jgi:multidrug efflux pump subunit AcrA (membrane-fusion protein)
MSSRSSLRNAGTLALLLSAASLLITGCKPAGPPPGAAAAQGPLPVQVVTSTLEDVPVTGQWVATTDGNVNAQIQPQVSGYLIRQDYKEGSDVHKGQVLFEIDPRPFQALVDQAKGTLAQAQGQVGQAQAQLALAAINVKRDTPLAAEHAIAQSQLDTETQTQAVDKAAVTSSTQPRLHQSPLTDRWRCRTGCPAGWQPGQHQLRAHLRLASQPHQGLLLHLRAGVPFPLCTRQAEGRQRSTQLR